LWPTARDPNLCRFDAFGFLVGLAFQITDDVLNLNGSLERYGKEIDGDLWEGKRTLLLTHALAHASLSDREWLAGFLERPREVSRLRKIIEDAGSIRWAQRSAAALAEAAARQFDEMAFAGAKRGPDLAWLRSCVDLVVGRDA
jgi:geranylgeranyl pyrophosphate synthase